MLLGVSDTPQQSASGFTRRWAAFFGENPPWRSRTVALAAAIMLVGLGFWLKDRGKLSADPAQVSALFRVGASYLGGYFLGWGFRRGLKSLVIIAGVMGGTIAVLQTTGWLDLNWDSIRQNLDHSFDWLRGETEGWRRLLMGYLPSATLAAVGFFFGTRRK